MLLVSILLCVVAFGLLSAHADNVNHIQLNPNSTIYQDVHSVAHDIDKQLLRIEMKEIRRCDSPSFMVRLSGSSLYLLDRVKQNHTHTSEKSDHVIHFSFPPILDQGTYFIELVVIYCSAINPHVHVNNCMEDVQHGNNVINLPYSFDVSRSTVAFTKPRWVLNNSTTPVLLPTRYQKTSIDCVKVGEFCQSKPEDIQQHHQYDWTNPPEYRKTVQRLVTVNKTSTEEQPHIKICMIGSSHAREIGNAGIRLSIEGIVWFFIWSSFPVSFEAGLFQTYACSYAIVTYGQWPFGYLQPNKQYTPKTYEAEMRQVFSKIVTRTNAFDTQVFMLSLNYNGLGSRYTSCPPADSRSPPVIDYANNIVHTLSVEHSVGYIDMSHIIGPLWDSEMDWDHPYGKVFTAEAEWVLQYVLEYSIKQHKLPPIRYAHYQDHLLIRFTDSKTVYLYKDNVVRAFPDGHTFMSMGYDFGDIVVQTEYNRAYYTFGSQLQHV